MNHLGLNKSDYKGLASTLCIGCGHDSITSHLISALYQSHIDPKTVAKISGIGCSSKTPAYFLHQSHGFNTNHGRMAPIAMGAKVANKDLKIIGISGDGDTSNIGLGGFCHLVRRNLPMLYITENNGLYGLTKGQFSATADKDSTLKSGVASIFHSIDLCSLAIQLGCGFVARSFSGDSRQLVPLISLALRYKGLAFIDVISPCVAFGNHKGSTKSYSYVKQHKLNLQEMGFIQPNDEIKVDYKEGTTEWVQLPDGSQLWLKKLDPSHDHKDSFSAMSLLKQARDRQQILTGLFYFNTELEDCVGQLELTHTPLVRLKTSDITAKSSLLKEVNAELK